MNQKINLVAIMFIIFASSIQGQDLNPKNKAKDTVEAEVVRIWFGYSTYRMNDFNTYLNRDGNNPMHSGVNFSIELPFDKILSKVKYLEFLGAILKNASILPIGIEYLYTSSYTTLDNANNHVSIYWHLPIIGFYYAPDYNFLLNKQWLLYLQPIGLGYYFLGKQILNGQLQNDRLTISDRYGELDVSDKALGFLSQIGVKYTPEPNYEFFIRGGYRWLKFTNVQQEPIDGFPAKYGGTPVQAGPLGYPLDYSGFFIKTGVSFKL